MSKLKEYREIERALKAHQERLKSLETNEQLTRYLEFERKLTALMKRYSMGIADLVDYLNLPLKHAGLSVKEKPIKYGYSGRKASKRTLTRP
ncbi:hypothetical protein EGJ27_13650 [Pseudomonas sp. v388]|uniref:hypothetical protein n=1 Tax=Pseudomonas sp. v388 TaxID=2479849 RepID=UPI000F7AF941|nr:hypothetical protein [Pseudomonas sp. v388]RRV06796.1 hypothetical protein EGJ27_13650 [Pseudomonas sp. v388]